jgi:hypothetical protein
MSRLPAVLLAGLVLLLGAAGCSLGSDVGYVEIKAMPPSTTPPLYLDSVKVEPLREGVAILRHRVGTTKLQTEAGGGQLALLCNVIVKKNRITTVTVSVLDRPPRCQCRTDSGAGSALPRSCIS